MRMESEQYDATVRKSERWWYNNDDVMRINSVRIQVNYRVRVDLICG